MIVLEVASPFGGGNGGFDIVGGEGKSGIRMLADAALLIDDGGLERWGGAPDIPEVELLVVGGVTSGRGVRGTVVIAQTSLHNVLTSCSLIGSELAGSQAGVTSSSRGAPRFRGCRVEALSASDGVRLLSNATGAASDGKTSESTSASQKENNWALFVDPNATVQSAAVWLSETTSMPEKRRWNRTFPNVGSSDDPYLPFSTLECSRKAGYG